MNSSSSHCTKWPKNRTLRCAGGKPFFVFPTAVKPGARTAPRPAPKRGGRPSRTPIARLEVRLPAQGHELLLGVAQHVVHGSAAFDALESRIGSARRRDDRRCVSMFLWPRRLRHGRERTVVRNAARQDRAPRTVPQPCVHVALSEADRRAISPGESMPVATRRSGPSCVLPHTLGDDQPSRRLDQCEVRERLREVAEVVAGRHVVLLRVQPER